MISKFNKILCTYKFRGIETCKLIQQKRFCRIHKNSNKFRNVDKPDKFANVSEKLGNVSKTFLGMLYDANIAVENMTCLPQSIIGGLSGW